MNAFDPQTQDQAKVIDLEDELNRRFLANDVAVANMYTEDYIGMAPNADAIPKAGIVPFMHGFNAMALMRDYKVVTTNVRIDSDIAVSDFTYEMRFEPYVDPTAKEPQLSGRVIRDHGKGIVVWRRSDDTWLRVRSIWNTSVPLS